MKVIMKTMPNFKNVHFVCIRLHWFDELEVFFSGSFNFGNWVESDSIKFIINQFLSCTYKIAYLSASNGVYFNKKKWNKVNCI